MEAPRPPRYRWLKRILAAAVTVVVALVVAQRWWAHAADRRYHAFIDAARANGEPVLPADFKPAASVANSRNAALSLTNAAGSLTLSQAFHDFANNYPGDAAPLTEAELNLCKTAAASNANALSLARTARSQPDVDWQITLGRPVVSTLLPYLSSQRDLAKFMRWSVKAKHADGDDAESVEEIRDMLAAAHTMERGPGLLVGHMVALGLTSLACETVRENAFELRIEDGAGNVTPGLHPATRAQVRELIRELTDENAYTADALRAWQGERMMVLDGVAYAASGATPPYYGVANFPAPIRPIIVMDAVHAGSVIGEAINAAQMPSWPAAEAKLPQQPYRGDSFLEDVSRFSSRIFLPAVGSAIHHQYRAMTLRRVTALRLATRMYQIDHDGKYPTKLSELVPEYIPSLPVDPFAPDGRALTYLGAPKFVIYSLGDNGIDDGASTASMPSSASFSSASPGDWDHADVVFPLDPRPASTQPSVETQDH